jgi:hypothetical protein
LFTIPCVLALRETHSRSPLLREDERARLPRGHTRSKGNILQYYRPARVIDTTQTG